MRCPKCQYISFDNGERCRNCGYEFALSTPDEPPLDVAIGRDEPRPGRARDVTLTKLDTPTPKRQAAEFDAHTPADAFAASRRPLTAADLPLFTDRVADDQAPLVSPSAVPRQPLSVRRANVTPRPRPRNPLPEELSLDLSVDADAAVPIAEFPDEEIDTARSGSVAGVFRRATAGVIDLIVLGAIEGAVAYMTLRVCELTPEQWRELPLLPLIAFMLLLAGGYFVLFTAAGGQTIGKMTTRIRVVSVADEGATHRVSFSAAMVRAAASLGSVLALGAGFLPVLFRADRRAFHDRVADTRVVIV